MVEGEVVQGEGEGGKRNQAVQQDLNSKKEKIGEEEGEGGGVEG